MKKIISFLLVSIMAVWSLSACGNTNPKAEAETMSNDKLRVVCTIFPEYDWIREVLGEHMEDAEVTMLLDNGVDLHSYQPTTDDIIKISTCDMFVYVGGESDSWVKNALEEATNKDMIVINLMDILGDTVKEEELIEGMEAHEHEHDQEKHDHEEGAEYDEHVWLSLKNAKLLCSYIATKLAEIDESNDADYTSNANAYIEKLTSLDKSYQHAVEEAKHKTLLFGDRFPFLYLVDDYGLSYYAAFVGCSAETEASFETITFLSSKVDELGLNAVLTIDGVQHKIAETVIENTQEKNQNILTLNSMQSITSHDIENGVSYLTIMEKNLDVLKKALN